jgi:hypothetical protein
MIIELTPALVNRGIMKHNNRIIFYRFLNGEYLLNDFEEFIYSNDDLESEIGGDVYLELVGFNTKDKNYQNRLMEFIFESIISIGEFLTWRIREMLIDFIEYPEKVKELLDKFYEWTYGLYNSEGKIVDGFKFLQNLGMNNFYWMDEGYLRMSYGDNWQIEYKRYKDDFEFYHKQLKPIAINILEAIDKERINIKGQGDYEITNLLKAELESDQIFELKHKEYIV